MDDRLHCALCRREFEATAYHRERVDIRAPACIADDFGLAMCVDCEWPGVVPTYGPLHTAIARVDTWVDVQLVGRLGALVRLRKRIEGAALFVTLELPQWELIAQRWSDLRTSDFWLLRRRV